MQISESAWFNGALVSSAEASPSVASNTLHLGIAVFDGIMAYWNGDHWYPHLLREHVERFVRGSAAMEIEHSYDADEIEAGIHKLLATLPKTTHYIRPIAYRTGAELFFDVDHDTPSVCVFALPIERDVNTPYRCQLSPVERLHHKAIPVSWKVSGSYANSFRCEQEAKKAGFDNGVMLDQRGRVAEVSTSNVFFVDHGRLITPRADGDIFPGLTRELLLELAAQRGIEAAERDIWPEQLPGFEAAFLCGTLSEVRPIDRIGDIRYATAENEVYSEIIRIFRQVTHK